MACPLSNVCPCALKSLSLPAHQVFISSHCHNSTCSPLHMEHALANPALSAPLPLTILKPSQVQAGTAMNVGRFQQAAFMPVQDSEYYGYGTQGLSRSWPASSSILPRPPPPTPLKPCVRKAGLQQCGDSTAPGILNPVGSTAAHDQPQPPFEHMCTVGFGQGQRSHSSSAGVGCVSEVGSLQPCVPPESSEDTSW